MNRKDCENSILDSLLEEIFNQAAPPDLSAAILEKWARRETDLSQPSSTTSAEDLPQKALDSHAAGLHQLARPSVYVEAGESGEQRDAEQVELPDQLASRLDSDQRAVIGPWVLAVSILIVVTLGTIWFWKSPPAQLAQKPADTLQPAGNAARPNVQRPAAAAKPAEPPFVAPADDAAIVRRISELLRDDWNARAITPSPPANDSEWCRRAYLRLIGRIPTVEELQEFVGHDSGNRQADVVDQLLHSSRYSEDYVRYWSLLWTNILIGRQGGTQPGDKGNREGLLSYLRNALGENLPYDRLTIELLTATGTAHAGQADFNGATNFLLCIWSDRHILATARSSRVFLGQQLRCVQCHDHHANDWQQERFWQLNAMFRQMRVEGSGQETRLVNSDFRGESIGAGDGEIYYELPDGQLRVAYPGFPDATSMSPRSGIVETDRRQALAEWLVERDDLAAAFVNRMWGHFFGYGFVNPVDNMGPHNPPSHPELLDFLARQFVAHQYDTKRLLAWITLSEPFGLSSKTVDGHLADNPTMGAPAFSRYYTRQLQPEEVYQSLLVVANTRFTSWTDLVRDRQAFLGQVSQRLKTDDGAERNSFDGGVGQSLLMMNGSLVRRALRQDPPSLLSRVIHADMPEEDKVEHLFLAAVSRKPTPRESQLAARMMDQADDVTLVLQDIWWALLNSNEFILDH